MEAVGHEALRDVRERISANDRRIVEAVNERLRLVEEIQRVKTEHGIDFFDPDRERRLVAYLQETNAGPLSDDGVRELIDVLLDLTKRELG
jgi:chorismate mutase